MAAPADRLGPITVDDFALSPRGLFVEFSGDGSMVDEMLFDQPDGHVDGNALAG